MLDESRGRLSPSVALRPEPFGALAYHFGNRKLTFLKRPELVAVVRGLGEHPDVRTASMQPACPPTSTPATPPPSAASRPPT